MPIGWFGLDELLILGLLADGLCRRLGVPGLIGMLGVGLLLGQSGLGLIDPRLLALSSDLRQMALVVILLRVGFGLNLKTLQQVGKRMLLLAWIPAAVEGFTISLVAQPFLGLTWLEAGLLGSVIAAVSPAVVVQLMLRLIEEQRGTEKPLGWQPAQKAGDSDFDSAKPRPPKPQAELVLAIRAQPVAGGPSRSGLN